MNIVLKSLLCFTLLCAAGAVQADVTVNSQVMQKGIFSPPKCDGTGGCLCESDIIYPSISGMRNADKQAAINDTIMKSAEQLKCQGTAVDAKSSADNFSVTHNYEVTFNSPHFLGLRFTDWAYEGGAHGNGTVEGMIIDLDSGKVLSPADIFDNKRIADVNRVIYNALAPKADGIFRDEIESRKDAFIKDGKCQGCTLVLDKNGVEVVFQAYEVAPFADGNPTVTIPAKDISYPALAASIGTKKK
ncbi:MAG TPA: DUF3298 and DUF4163 domain-containing protein [Rickettsiales bacterium]|nr:DUF3298 and DUF4163 domain-containing protein [Rickettsiales bacterium]